MSTPMNPYTMRLSTEFPKQLDPLEGFIINFGTKEKILLKPRLVNIMILFRPLSCMNNNHGLFIGSALINSMSSINTVFV